MCHTGCALNSLRRSWRDVALQGNATASAAPRLLASLSFPVSRAVPPTAQHAHVRRGGAVSIGTRAVRRPGPATVSEGARA